MIQFRLNTRSGVPTYLQLVQQVRQAVRLGILLPGDQLPTVKEVVSSLAINPNTVLKAYRELDREGLVEGRRGRRHVRREHAAAAAAGPTEGAARRRLQRWIGQARAAGLDEESMAALFATPCDRRSCRGWHERPARPAAPRGSASATARSGRCGTARWRSRPGR